MNNYVKTNIHLMAKLTKTNLTDKHFEVLEYAYNYYQKHKVGPLYANILKNIAVRKEDINSMFPYGLNSVYTWVGIPIHTTKDGCKPAATVNVENPREVYMDYNGTTPLRPEIVSYLNNFFSEKNTYGNPSSSTRLGETTFNMIENAKERILHHLNAKYGKIIFTGCGTESNNFAIKGIAFKHFEKKGHIITTEYEHSSVLKTVKFLETLGYTATYIKPNREGFIKPEDIERAIQEDTILVSVVYANNEIGTINDIERIGKICKWKNVPFMTDAIQAFGKIPIDVETSNIDILTFSGHKIYAPKGIGGIYLSKNIELIPLLHGGEQEYGLRGGTENVAYITALGLASNYAYKEMESEAKRLNSLKAYFIDELTKIEPEITINGTMERRLPNNLNVGFPNYDSGSILLSLNQIGAYVSSGSACSSGSREVSHVIKSIGVDTEKYGVVRFSFGLFTTKEDLDYVLQYLPEILRQLRENN